MKKLIKCGAAAICALTLSVAFSGCSGEKINIIPDPNPYIFDNSANVIRPDCDEGMNIDGKFDEEKWKNVRWLSAEDKPNATQSAKIEFASFVGEKGIFIGGKVEETGSNIWVNPDRGSWTNSCLEMYIGPVGYGEEGKHKTIEYDVQADGSVNNMRVAPDQSSGFDIHTTWDKMPLTAAQQIGGKVNTPDCTGYTIESFIPWAFLELAGWDVSDPSELKVGIDPVHIFSLKYEGEDVSDKITETRIWSRWSEKVLPGIGWLAPDTYFRFDKGGLMQYEYEVNYSGEGKGTVATKSGSDKIFGWGTTTFTVKPRNGAIIKRITVNGEDYTAKLRESGGSYEFDVKDPEGKLTIDVEFGFE